MLRNLAMADKISQASCKKCKIEIKEDDDFVECDMCTMQYHHECTPLRQLKHSDFVACKAVQGVHWYCKKCNGAIYRFSKCFSSDESKLGDGTVAALLNENGVTPDGASFLDDEDELDSSIKRKSEKKKPLLPTPHHKQETFQDLNVSQTLQTALDAYGIDKPSEFHRKIYDSFIKGSDCIVQTQPSNESIISLALLILQKVKPDVPKTQALILVPVREQGLQIKKEIEKLSTYLPIYTYACIGGTDSLENAAQLRRGVHIVVGTAGRVVSLFSSNTLQAGNINLFVVYELDEMFKGSHRSDKGVSKFTAYIGPAIDKYLKKDVQMVVTCDNMDYPESDAFYEKYLKKPVRITVDSGKQRWRSVSQCITHFKRPEQRIDTLCNLYSNNKWKKIVVFCNTRKNCTWLADQMYGRGLNTLSTCDIYLLSTPEIEAVTEEFLNGPCPMLITNGIIGKESNASMEKVTMIVNYDIPESREEYVYRMRRAGFYSVRKFDGYIYNYVVHPQEKKLLEEICEHYDTDMPYVSRFA